MAYSCLHGSFMCFRSLFLNYYKPMVEIAGIGCTNSNRATLTHLAWAHWDILAPSCIIGKLLKSAQL